MSLLERAGEGLARRMNRRKVVRRTAAAIFGSVAAWSVKGMRGSAQLADYCTYVEQGECACDPPYDQYCTDLDPSYCDGPNCGSGCTVDETYWTVGGCWCSATCQYSDDNGNPLIGYYKCCDCDCYGTSCSCRQFQQVERRQPPPPPPSHGGSSDHGGIPFPPGFPFNR